MSTKTIGVVGRGSGLSGDHVFYIPTHPNRGCSKLLPMIYIMIWYLHDIFHEICNLHVQSKILGRKPDKNDKNLKKVHSCGNS